jgi:hypothetical protein
LSVLILVGAEARALASPWAEVGDAQLRSDIEVLSAAGVIDNVTSQWPLPWANIVSRLESGAADGQPDYVRDAAERVLEHAKADLHPDSLAISATADVTNLPSVVRGFDGLGREDFQAQASGEYMSDSGAIRINAGAQVDHGNGHVEFMPDGSYGAVKLGGALVYAGYVTHWWGPGWRSALSLSNNARPMPQIGIERGDTSALQSPWLSWIGPWQMEFLVGWLDDSRVATNTVFVGFETTINPFPGFEFGFGRTTEMCGKGHDCSIGDYFDIANDPAHINKTNDEGDIHLRYTRTVSGHPVEVYAQFMNEDTNPFVHSLTSHLVGGSAWFPMGESMLRATVEYADSVPTVDIFSFGDVGHGIAYNNAGYVDGMRYRGRTLGFSLDSDSTLLTLQTSYHDAANRVFTFTFDHAAVSNPHNFLGNVVTTAPVHINMFTARAEFPYRGMLFDVEGRVQDDQPRPDHGATAAIEAAAKVPF